MFITCVQSCTIRTISNFVSTIHNSPKLYSQSINLPYLSNKILQSCFALFGPYLLLWKKTNHLGAMNEGRVMDHKPAKRRSGRPKMLILKHLRQLNHEFEIYLNETLRMYILPHRKHISPTLQQ